MESWQFVIKNQVLMVSKIICMVWLFSTAELPRREEIADFDEVLTWDNKKMIKKN